VYLGVNSLSVIETDFYSYNSGWFLTVNKFPFSALRLSYDISVQDTGASTCRTSDSTRESDVLHVDLVGLLSSFSPSDSSCFACSWRKQDNVTKTDGKIKKG